MLSYQLNKRFAFGSACVYGSGQTYTPVIGKVHQSGVNRWGSLEHPYAYLGNIYGVRNSAAYPNYFRLDASFTMHFDAGKLKFQIINVTDYYNVLLYNWNHSASPSRVQAYSMFPRIFSIGFEFKI